MHALVMSCANSSLDGILRSGCGRKRQVVRGLEAPIVWKLLAPHSALRVQARPPTRSPLLKPPAMHAHVCFPQRHLASGPLECGLSRTLCGAALHPGAKQQVKCSECR